MIGMSNTHLVGFSIRCTRNDPDWTPLRRQEFLLNPRVSRPISVDPDVWEQLSPNLLNVGGVGVRLPYWEDHQAMLNASQYASGLDDAVEVTIVVYATERLPEFAEAAGVREVGEATKGKTSLGYDIADDGLISGLSNCAYTSKDRQAFEEFVPHLNRYGLLTSLEVADRFRSLTDARVPDHAPFFVYQIFADREP